MSPNRRALRSMTAAAVLVPFVVALPANAAPAIHSTAPPQTTSSATTVTLITGDKVSIAKQADGRTTTLLKPGTGREKIVFSARAVNGHVHVIPSDAGPLLAAGRLDERLFDVTQLVEFGYDDTTSKSLPLIVTGGGNALGAATVTRQLPSVDGVAIADAKQGTFWQSLTAPGAASVSKIWLNGKAKVHDAGSSAQIGVPAARQAGFDGTGVNVAVLDTGVDVTHPDLKEVIGETKDFTGSANGIADGVGHGTHVSSIIAGTGAKTAANEGVAPKAKILMGKVCGTQFCEDDAILAGMEWAAGKAKVVNMSLGSDRGTNDDLISQALNKLTATTGSLFVASAGNAGGAHTIAAPAAADAALAVASVGRTDVISDFSSRGPRSGDEAVKPDIAAPGEAIVAARATATSMGSPVDDFYTAASGTSMAAPHVTGVAALVAQAHPDWTAGQLKAALMSSAVPANLDIYDAGAGRVDAARAVKQTVFADNSVSFPRLTWPYTAPAPKAVTYRNAGSTPVTLNLELSNKDYFTLSAATLTVPANGSAQVTVGVDASRLPTAGGALGTRIAATATNVSVRTAVGVFTEPESYTVQLTLLDRNGKPAANGLGSNVSLYGHTAPDDWDFSPRVVDGVASIRVPKGDFTVRAETQTTETDTTVEVIPTLTVTKDAKITLDARKGARAALTVADQPAAVSRTFVLDYPLSFNGRGVGAMVFVQGNPEVYVVPTTGGGDTTVQLGISAVLGSHASEAKPYQYYVTATAPPNTFPAKPVFQTRTRDLGQYDARFRGQGRQGLAEFARAPQYLSDQFFIFGAYNTVALPTVRTEYLSTVPWSAAMSFQRPIEQPNPTAPFGMVLEVGVQPVAGKRVPSEWNAASVGPSLALSPNFATQIYRSGENLSAFIGMFTPAAPNQGNNVGFQTITSQGDTTLQLEGTEPVGSGLPGVAGFGGLPAESSRYTLRATGTRIDWVPWSELSTQVEAVWKFTSSDADDGLLPLMYLRTNGNFDGLNKAPAGPFALKTEVLRQPRTTSTAKVKRVTVDYSTDDGKTWTPAIVIGRDSTWHVLLLNPRSGFVSLRTTATDTAGDSHSTTVIRAYGIR